MARGIIILALLASLFYLVRHLQPEPQPLPSGKVAASRAEKSPETAEGEETAAYNPPVAAPLPDVNKGYIFSEKRKFEKDEPPETAKAQVEQGPDLLASVTYSGSVISGNLRRGLVVFQEQPREAQPRRPSSVRAQMPVSQLGSTQNKQLNLGDRFLGYVVAAIEPDRIVFEKGDRKVEKFLYDPGKKRLAPPEPSRQEAAPEAPMEAGGVPLQALAPPEVLAALMAPPSAGRTGGGTVPGGPPAGGQAGGDTAGAATGTTPVPPTRVLRRSQRMFGIDPSIKVPATPVPGLPVPNK